MHTISSGNNPEKAETQNSSAPPLAELTLNHLADSFKAAMTGIIALDEKGEIAYINAKAQRFLDLSQAQAVGKKADELFEDINVLSLCNADQSGPMHPYYWHEYGIMVCSHNYYEQKGGFSGRMLMLHEMDAHQEELNQLKEELSWVLENSYDGIIIADPDEVLKVNASFGRITGVAPSALIGIKINDLDTERHVCLAAVQEVIRMTRHHRKSLTLHRKLTSGNEIFLTGSPVFDRHNYVSRIVVNIRDVTELRNLKDQINNLSLICRGPSESVDESEPKALKGIVAESPAMKRLLDLVMRVSLVDSTVLLQGESGVGKDVIARLINKLSLRNDKPFISVNCGAVPETLLESEFFGYEKGAFTSASRNGKPGLFEQANGGTLFLDEVGELPLNLQVKLLKAIQDKRCRRLGGSKNIDLDLRIIAATNRDLRKMVKEGSFREDLFYRLYVVPIEIAPLRERRDDILPLALMFLKQFNKKYDVIRTLGHELMTILESYDWPGNVRELQNVVERMVVTADAEVLEARHLPNSVYQQAADNGLCLWMGGTMKLKQAREALEKQLISKALSQTGNTRKASKLLGVDHSTVVRKAKKYSLSLRGDANQNDE